MPVNTGRFAEGSTTGFGRTFGRALAVVPAPPAISVAATVATFPRSAVTSPVPSGCRRLERKITYDFDPGSTQMLVPVNPVWPNEAPIGNRSPRLAEYDVSISHPSP